ncbi:MAG: hypothetical protein AAGE52_40170 [Myxococcota bacterium]
MKTKIPKTLLVYPVLIATWSAVFAAYSFLDGLGVYSSFGIDLACDPFALGNSAARYAGIAAALWVAILALRSVDALILAMIARAVMDIGDTVTGLQTGILPFESVWQPFVMFLGPEAYVLIRLFQLRRRDGA